MLILKTTDDRSTYLVKILEKNCYYKIVQISATYICIATALNLEA